VANELKSGVQPCDKCEQPNDRASEGNYCGKCRSAFQARVAADPETQPVGSKAGVKSAETSAYEAAEIAEKSRVREELLKTYPLVWDTAELQRDYVVLGFQAPYVVVRRKSDDKLGSLQFCHRPRFYFGFVEDV
jgi:hypothetical protein